MDYGFGPRVREIMAGGMGKIAGPHLIVIIIIRMRRRRDAEIRLMMLFQALLEIVRYLENERLVVRGKHGIRMAYWEYETRLTKYSLFHLAACYNQTNAIPSATPCAHTRRRRTHYRRNAIQFLS